MGTLHVIDYGRKRKGSLPEGLAETQDYFVPGRLRQQRAIICGALAQRPQQAGHAWVFCQFLRGFKALNLNVLFLDHVEASMTQCADAGESALAASKYFDYCSTIMVEFGLQEGFSIDYNRGERIVGRSRQEVLERTKHSDVLINVMGYLDDEEILAAAPRKVFLDIDPGFGQMWEAQGLCRFLHGHDDYVTIGLNIGRPECEIPTCGIDWITTPQPVVLDLWPEQAPLPSARFTSVASWRGPFGPIEYNGKTYGLRVHEFRKFLELPRRTSQDFELALDIHPDETRDLALLCENGWPLVDPRHVAGTPHDYQAYIQGSKAEFGVAKSIYVQTNSGWISDRTICYLASGKPALVQDTGIRAHVPTGEGLVTFSDIEEAVEGVERICRDYERHCKAARRIAEEYFDADKVLTQLLQKLGID